MGRSRCFILLGSKHTSRSFLRNREFMMFSTGHYWNRTPQRRSRCIRRIRRNWTPATKGNIRWKQFGIARSMQESQNRVTYQVSTTWYLGKRIQRKKIPENQPQRSSTLESSSAYFTRTTLTNRRQLFL